MKKPKIKSYKPSAEEIELQNRQLEEIRERDSEIAEQKYRRQRGAKKRSLLDALPNQPKAETLGAA